MSFLKVTRSIVVLCVFAVSVYTRLADPIRRWFVRRAVIRMSGRILQAQEAFWEDLTPHGHRGIPTCS